MYLLSNDPVYSLECLSCLFLLYPHATFAVSNTFFVFHIEVAKYGLCQAQLGLDFFGNMSFLVFLLTWNLDAFKHSPKITYGKGWIGVYPTSLFSAPIYYLFTYKLWCFKKRYTYITTTHINIARPIKKVFKVSTATNLSFIVSMSSSFLSFSSMVSPMFASREGV